MLLGLRTAIYRTPDLAEGKRWYTKVLGFAPYFDQPFYVGFNVGGYRAGSAARCHAVHRRAFTGASKDIDERLCAAARARRHAAHRNHGRG